MGLKDLSLLNIKDIYKWYDIDHVKEVNPYNLNKEMRYATASIILNS